MNKYSDLLPFTTTKIPPCPCPYCGVSRDAVTALEDGQRPSAGAISICGECGELGIIVNGKRVRKATMKELADIQRSPQWPVIEGIMRGIKAFQLLQGRKP